MRPRSRARWTCCHCGKVFTVPPGKMVLQKKLHLKQAHPEKDKG